MLFLHSARLFWQDGPDFVTNSWSTVLPRPSKSPLGNFQLGITGTWLRQAWRIFRKWRVEASKSGVPSRWIDVDMLSKPKRQSA